MSWTIKGDSDITPRVIGGITYGLDATVRSFESMVFSGWSLRTESCGDDVFSYTQATRNAKGAGVIVPEEGQKISVYYAGERRLLGKVRKPKLGLSSLSVSAYGPWAEMTEIQLSGTREDETGASSDRNIFAVPAQGIRETLRDIINRAADMGVPVNKITTDTEMNARISSMFAMMRMSLSNMSFAAAFTEVMGLVPDAVAFWDYTQSPPALCVKRRGAMTPLSDYAVGASGTVRVTRCEIAPRVDLHVRRLELKYMQRHPQTGKTIFKTQSAGVPTGSLTDDDRRRFQTITVSGPEQNDFVPKDDIESVVLQTQQVYLSAGWALYKDQVIKDLKLGLPPGSSPITNDPIPNAHFLINGEATDWLKKEQAIKSREVRVTGWVALTESTAGGYGALGAQLKALGRLRHFPLQDYYEIFVDFTIPVISKSFPKKTRFYKKLGYQYRKPLDGLAEEFLAARAFTPWEGQVEITRPDLNGYNALERTLNITGSHPDHATMNAMIRAVTYDGRAHTVTFDLGGPARTSIGSLVNRTKTSGKDNFDYL